jgi:dCTP deaminase
MILSGKKILSEVDNGNIYISPFNEEFLNPTSYDLTLGDYVTTYVNNKLCIDKSLEVSREEVGDWIVLEPNRGYLLHTHEVIHTKKYAAIVDGKSSLGRLFISIHQTAGFIDPGFNGQITLEVSVLYPIIIKPRMRIAQIRFHHIDGEIDLYDGHYKNDTAIGAVPSMCYKKMITSSFYGK